MTSWFDDNDVPKNLRDDARILYEYFEPRRACVVHVRLLCNFGPKLDGEGYRGLSVQLKPTYELAPSDRIWLHENQYQSMTIALCHVTEEVMAKNLIAVRKKVWATTGFEGSDDFGVYMERRAHEYSTELEHIYHAIVTRTPDMETVPLEGTVEQWVQRERAAYTAIDARETNMKLISSIFPSAECVDHRVTNMFLRDNSTWRFINCAWNVRPTETDVFIRTHPSMGYCRFTLGDGDVSRTIPQDMGVSETVIAIEDMPSARWTHVKTTHRWDSKQRVHLRAQLEARDWRRDAPMRRMGVYDPTPIHVIAIKMGYPRDPMTLERGCELTSGPVRYAFDRIAARLTPAALPLFKPAYVKDGSLCLTREDCIKFGICGASACARSP